ncbi:MAG: histidine kinase dimerization/phospho-acceptor domain-containing protein [Gemmatimonadota bacterium]
MSLRQKIVLLFFGLAVLPLLAVATFGFLYSAHLNREAVTARLGGAVAELSDKLDASTAQVRQALKRVPTFPLPGPGDGSQDRGGPTAWQPDHVLASAAFVRVVDRRGSSVTLAGAPPEPGTRCRPSGGARAVAVRAIVGGAGDRIAEAHMWMDDLIALTPSAAGLHTQIVDRNTGIVMFSADCQELQDDGSAAGQAALAMLDEIRANQSSFDFRDGANGRRIGSASVSADGRWVAVAEVGLGSVVAPFGRLGAWYWVFVILLAASTSLAFSALLGRVTNSLKELIRASKRIGAGDLVPWLPPPGEDEVGELTVAFREMSDQIKRMVGQVDQNSRLAVVGELSAYLAHEIRNPLSCVKMNLQRIERWGRTKPLPDELKESVEISLKEVDRLGSSLTSILQLARRDQTQEQIVSLHAVLTETNDLLRGEFDRAGVEVTLDLDAAHDRVRSDPGHLKGAFLNLMMNGLEAQPDGGRLHFRSVLENVAGMGPAVAVHIRDDGSGVPNDIRERIFEPFFTTKSNGSGIGLAVVSRTLHSAGGDVYLADLPVWEQGAEFVVRMPLAAVSDSLTANVPREEPTKCAEVSARPSISPSDKKVARVLGTHPSPVSASPNGPGPAHAAREAWHTDDGRFH